MQEDPQYDDLMGEILGYFHQKKAEYRKKTSPIGSLTLDLALAKPPSTISNCSINCKSFGSSTNP